MKKILILASLFGVVATMAWGLTRALHSPLFLVRVVEVNSSIEPAPLDDDAVIRISEIPVGRSSLYQINVADVERRLLGNEWIRDVRVSKKYPQTVSISVIYREPQAFFQTARGHLAYVDTDGRVFGSVNLLTSPDLPVLSGFHQEELKSALLWMGRLEKSQIAKVARLSSLTWVPDRGYRAVMIYGRNSSIIRTVVEMGDLAETSNWLKKFENLAAVISYLDRNSIASRRVSIEQDKKVVVKITRGS